MKYLLSLLLAFNVATAAAQIVNIPDPAFKNYLLTIPDLDINGDMEIQESEALSRTSIYIDTNLGITDLTGIRSFTNLGSFTIYQNPITTIDFTGLNQLRMIDCENNSLASIILTGCTNLQSLECGRNQLTTLDLNNFTQLEYLWCSQNMLTSLGIAGCNNLQQIHADYNNFTNFNFSGLPNLRTVDLNTPGGSTPFDEIIGDSTPNLVSVFLGDGHKVSIRNSGLGSITTGHVGTLDISNCVRLDMLLQLGIIDTLIATGCSGLKTLASTIINNSLDVTGCTALNMADISVNAESVDFSTCINLTQLRLSQHGPDCKYINIKNGSFTNLSLGTIYSPTLKICGDDFEVDSLRNLFLNSTSAMGFNGVIDFSSACSFFPGGNYNTIKGKVRIDANNNGCETTDPGMANVPIRITDADGNTTVLYSVFSGAYAHYPGAGNFTLNPYFAYPYFNIAPLSAPVSFDTANHLIDSVDFCVTPNGTHNDLEVSVLPVTPARPGFATSYKLVYKNKGTTTQSGNVQLNFDNSKMSFDAATPTVSSQSAGQLTWNYSNLLPFESRSVDVNFTLLPPPVNNVGDTIYFMASINPVVNDETAYDNSFILPQGIRGSFDPNDKECLEGPKLSIASLDKYLHYMIRFQNLGTDTAFNVVVNDALSDKFDWNTVEIVSASHTCDVKQIKNKLEFYFRDIKLPYAAINEPASHGFVAFKVKPKAGAVIGDSLNNIAAIYFDFNLPVITNTASTVVSPASSVPVKLEYFSLSSKPSGNLLTWKASSTHGSTSFGIEKSNDGIHFNNFGNIMATTDRCQLPFNFTDNKPFDGKTFYRLNITDADGLSFYSKVLVAGKNKSGLQITAVVNDRNNTIAYLSASKQQNIQMKIIAADGKWVFNQSKTIMPGNSTLNLSLKNLASGIYTLIVYTNEGEIITKRFMK